jgi:hypothetical protein
MEELASVARDECAKKSEVEAALTSVSFSAEP